MLSFFIVLTLPNTHIMFNLQLSAQEAAEMVAPAQNLKPAIVLQDGLDNIVKMVCLYYVGHNV